MEAAAGRTGAGWRSGRCSTWERYRSGHGGPNTEFLTVPSPKHHDHLLMMLGCGPLQVHLTLESPVPLQAQVSLEKAGGLPSSSGCVRIHWPKNGGMPRFIRYLSDMPGMTAQDMITDISPIGSSAKERTGYPTQKPLALLRRFIEASTEPGDMVLDPFCGCATALVASEGLGRQWIGIDVSTVAVKLVHDRMRDELGLFGLGIIERSDIPRRKGKRSRNIRETLYSKQAGDCNLCREHFPSPPVSACAGKPGLPPPGSTVRP